MSNADSNLIATPVVLTVAGSDSGGGAGIQADLRTFDDLNVKGVTAISCVTAQNTSAVHAVESVSTDMVSLQVKTVCEEYSVSAAKTGILYSGPVIQAVARVIQECNIPNLVVDPVMVSTSGSRLLNEDAVAVFCSDLIPLATVLTPNLSEAEILADCKISSIDDLKDAAQCIADKYSVACVVKGGHLEGDHDVVMDVLYCEGSIHEYVKPRADGEAFHGSGCVFSAALASKLASGVDLPESVEAAKAYVTALIQANVSR